MYFAVKVLEKHFASSFESTTQMPETDVRADRFEVLSFMFSSCFDFDHYALLEGR